MNEIKKLIEDRLEKLPQEVASAVKNVPWIDSVVKIANNNNLNSEQQNSLLQEVAIVILGLESAQNFPENLFNNVISDEDKVINIAKEIDESVILEIQKAIDRGKSDSPLSISSKEENLPMIEEGETVHDAPHVEQTNNPQLTTDNKIPIKVVQETPVSTPTPSPVPQPAPQPEIKPTPEPKIEVEPKAEVKLNTPKPSFSTQYPGGKDPYREPLA